MFARNTTPEIDIHCHILPSVDDGPGRLETSLAMASIAADDGTRIIIATPHTDGFRVKRESVTVAVDDLNHELTQHNIDIRIIPGFEIPYHLITELAATHTLGASKFVLVEFPHNFVPGNATTTISQLIVKGFQPVLAHPERNMDILENPDRINDLVAAGAQLQVTASSITGELGPDIQHCSHYLLRRKLIRYVATDSHSPTFRQPILSKACRTVAKLVGREQADLIFIHNPATIISSHAAGKSLSQG